MNTQFVANAALAANATYTLATLTDFGPKAIEGIPTNMTKLQAEKMASKAIANGYQCVAFNTRAE